MKFCDLKLHKETHSLVTKTDTDRPSPLLVLVGYSEQTAVVAKTCSGPGSLEQWFSTGGSGPKSGSQTRFQWVVGLCLGKEMLSLILLNSRWR